MALIKKPLVKKDKDEPKKKLLKKTAGREPEEEEESSEEEDETEEEEEAPKKKKLLKKAAKSEPEEEEEEEEESDEDEEEEAPVRKGSGKSKAPAKKKEGKSKSFADIFDSTKGGRSFIDPGDYRGTLIAFELEGEIADDPADQGELKIKATFQVSEDDSDFPEATISNWYNLCNDDGEPGPGIKFLKGDLELLGYEEILLEDLAEICEDVEATQPKIVFKVKDNKGYTNAYLQGLDEEADD